MSTSMFVTAVTVQIISRCQFGGIVVGKNSNLRGWQTEVGPFGAAVDLQLSLPRVQGVSVRALVFVQTPGVKRTESSRKPLNSFTSMSQVSCPNSKKTDKDFPLHCLGRKVFSISTPPRATCSLTVLFCDRKE